MHICDEGIKTMYGKRKRRYKYSRSFICHKPPIYIILQNAKISNSIIGTQNAHNTIDCIGDCSSQEQIIASIFKRLSDEEKLNVILYASSLTHSV